MEKVTDMQDMLLQRYDGIERIEVDDGIVLKFEEQIHILNQTAAKIFDLIDGVRTKETIIKILCEENNEDDVETHVMDFIQALLKAHLIHE